MDLELPNQIAGSVEVKPVVAFHEVSKWYGNVIGINKLTLGIPAGVTGLLGPNGAGKSTLLQLATGQLYPSQGTVEVLGQRVWNNYSLNRFIGLCPEQDAFYEWMTGFDFVETSARLSGMRRGAARDAAERTLAAVGMTKHQRRAIRGYSKGMRQRTKLAQALVHDPDVLFLDEPLTGTDPVAICDEYRKLAGRLVTLDDVEGVKVLAKESGLMVETLAPDAFYASLPDLPLTDGLAIREVYSDDDNLEAVFKYLVNK
jgi:ABC-type multidrug transport system ATPase subunit